MTRYDPHPQDYDDARTTRSAFTDRRDADLLASEDNDVLYLVGKLTEARDERDRARGTGERGE